ncbi:unnamed protein product, partial [Laminaria digitata]
MPPRPAIAGQCASSPPASIASCNRLPEPQRATCNALAGKRACLINLFERLGEEGLESCLVSCEATAAQQKLNEFILATGLSVATENYETMLASLPTSFEAASELFDQINGLDEVISDMERGRQVFYYENTNTGAVFEHFGKRFDPVPPLVF